MHFDQLRRRGFITLLGGARGRVAARGARIRNLILDEAVECAYLPKTLCFHQ